MRSCCCLAVLALCLPLKADTLVQWTFNSAVADANAGTGSTNPALGQGRATLLGGVTASFAAGDTKNDPAGSSDNSAWNTKSYPAATESNRTAGVRFDVDTRGYEALTLSWRQQNSATASRFLRLEYTTNGIGFASGGVICLPSASVFSNFSVSLDARSGAANNPAFGFRLVSEFELSATGSGSSAYVATATNSAYSKSGTLRFDLVTVSGTPIPGANTAPNISALPDQVLHVNQTGPALGFSISDAEDGPEKLALSKVSSNPAALPESGILLARNGTNCTVTLAAGSQPGISTVTLSVLDSGGRSNRTVFAATVLPANTAPSLRRPVSTNIPASSSSGLLPFTVADLETAAAALTVSASSLNQTLLPAEGSHLVLGGSGSNRTVIVTPIPGQSGVAPVVLSVSDGALSSNAVFFVEVLPSPQALVWENFDYPAGAVTTNSGFFWQHRSGGEGQCLTSRAALGLDPAQTEDVEAALPGGPYYKTNQPVLYSAFTMSVPDVVYAQAGYFASFANGSTFRGRVGLSTTNAAAGCYSLFVSTSSESNLTWVATNLLPQTPYTVVSRYDVAGCATRLWLHPGAETDPAVDARDLQTNSVSIASYAFRQDSSFGMPIEIESLRVGRSFASLWGAGSPPTLSIASGHGGVILSWSQSGCALQTALSPKGPYTTVSPAVSPYTNVQSGSMRFFRLLQSP